MEMKRDRHVRREIEMQRKRERSANLVFFGVPNSKTSSAEFTLSVAVGPIADRRALTSSFGLQVLSRADCNSRTALLLRSARLALPITLPPVAVRHVLISGLRFSACASCLLLVARRRLRASSQEMSGTSTGAQLGAATVMCRLQASSWEQC